jgi:hypothetical protein
MAPIAVLGQCDEKERVRPSYLGKRRRHPQQEAGIDDKRALPVLSENRSFCGAQSSERVDRR